MRGGMSDERVTRVGHNEALYRQVNERIEEINAGFGAITGGFVIVCECGHLACMEQITVARDVYEETRANPARFILKPGHDIDDVEVVVQDHGDFVVVEKTPGDARRVAQETDPRS